MTKPIKVAIMLVCSSLASYYIGKRVTDRWYAQYWNQLHPCEFRPDQWGGRLWPKSHEHVCPEGHVCAETPDGTITVLDADSSRYVGGTSDARPIFPLLYSGDTSSGTTTPSGMSPKGDLVGFYVNGGLVCSMTVTHDIRLGKGHTWMECAKQFMETAAELEGRGQWGHLQEGTSNQWAYPRVRVLGGIPKDCLVAGDTFVLRSDGRLRVCVDRGSQSTNMKTGIWISAIPWAVDANLRNRQ